MGTSEDGKSSKPEKSSSPTTDQQNLHVYPDWAKLQAYYGPRLAVPPYMNSPVTSGHAPPPPPYMWGPPQAMMSPYGHPYAAFYAHGGVYAHPGVPIASTPVSMETQAKSSENKDKSLVKKLKEFDGLAMSIGNNINTDSDAAEGGGGRIFSKSGETEDSSDGSNGNTTGVGQKSKKRSREGSPNNGIEGNAQTHSSTMHMVVHDKSTENVSTALELKDLSNANVTSIQSKSPPPPKTNESWLHSERDLKRERRKQSNRESARRSRLRKQAEAGELAMKVQTLTTENITLKSEINKLIENSTKLKVENSTLKEKLKDVQLSQTELTLHKVDDPRQKPIGTENLLARVNNSGRKNEGDAYENKSSGSKLRQLLDSKPRADAVAAS